jgi:hypothetical protein
MKPILHIGGCVAGAAVAVIAIVYGATSGQFAFLAFGIALIAAVVIAIVDGAQAKPVAIAGRPPMFGGKFEGLSQWATIAIMAIVVVGFAVALVIHYGT